MSKNREGSPQTHNSVIAEDVALCDKYFDGDEEAREEAGQELYKKYNRLIGMIAHDQARRKGLTDGAMDEDDVRQEAWEYALGAAETYHAKSHEDGGQNVRLSSYIAGTYARHHLDRKIDTDRYVVHVPADMAHSMSVIHAINHSRMQQRQALLSDEEMSEITGFPVGPYSAQGAQRTTGLVAHTDRLTLHMGSTDFGFNPGEDSSLGDPYDIDETHSLSSVTTDIPKPIDEQVVDGVEHRDLMDCIDALPASEREVLMDSYFGGMTNEAIAEKYGISRDKVRQRIARAEVKVRSWYSHAHGKPEFNS